MSHIHGTITTYSSRGCRCVLCVAAYRKARGIPDAPAPKPGIKHGTRSAYNYHGCRCATCREFNRVAKAAYLARKKKEAAR